MIAPATTDQADRNRIRTDLESTLFVEAGAGTGKTHELVQRVTALIATGAARMEGIAAITFTEAAAAELKERIRTGLEKAAEAGSYSAEEKERLRRASGEVDAAAIQTLHSFARRILAQHPLEAELPPGFEVADQFQANVEFEERWRVFLDEFLDREELQDTFARALCLGLPVKRLEDVGRALHENWDRLQEGPCPPLPALPDHGPVLQDLFQVLEERVNCKDPQDNLLLYLDELQGWCERLAGCKDELDALKLLQAAPPYKKGNKTKWTVDVELVREKVTAGNNSRQALLHKVKSDFCAVLLHALAQFVLNYAEERCREGRLHFHDLLVRARNLLRDNEEVRRSMSCRFTHLLVDEFQDSDPLQIEIASLIAMAPGGDPREPTPAQGRLFIVGDPKQSIYRFRRADIMLYRRTIEALGLSPVRLTQSFRSVPPLLGWINAVFPQLMDSAGQALYIALEAARAEDAVPGASVRVLGGPSAQKVGPMRDQEAVEIAALVRSVKEQGWLVAAPAGQSSAPARFKDIAILLPTRHPLPPLEEALERAGVPYRLASQSLIYSSQEVRDLLNILRAIDDPSNEPALVGALRSPAFGCGDDDLLRYRQEGGTWNYRRENPVDAGSPVIRGLAVLNGLHEGRWWKPLSDLIETVIRDCRLFELALAHRRPRERWQRLRFVLDQARAFSESGGSTLAQFVRWADLQASEKIRAVETVVPEPDDDAVQIMTVHAAKGLEFPVVFLAGLNLAPRSVTAPVLWSADGEPAVRIGAEEKRFESGTYAALKAVEAEMEAQESIRLLYVAATRARDHLVLSLHHTPAGPTSVPSHAERLHGLSQQFPGLSSEAVIPTVAEVVQEEPPRSFDDTPALRNSWLADRDQRLEALSRSRVLAATTIASETAAESVATKDEEPPQEEERPPWQRGRAGTSMGRAVHAVLQTIDLANRGGISEAARAQAVAEGIPQRAGEVERLVRAALAAPVVQQAAGLLIPHWREVYVAAEIDGVLVEGFVDLLLDCPDGLVIVEFKTDRIRSDEDMAAKMERYRLQGGAYALALQETVGKPVARCVFVFARAGDPQREVQDLAAAMEEVRQKIRQRYPPVVV